MRVEALINGICRGIYTYIYIYAMSGSLKKFEVNQIVINAIALARATETQGSFVA